MLTPDNMEFEKAKPFFLNDTLEYQPDNIVIKNILKKTTGQVTALTFDKGQALAVRVSAFDTFLYVIDGKSEVIIDHNSTLLEVGESIIVPAHCHHSVKAPMRFKMLLTFIKSGYEDAI